MAYFEIIYPQLACKANRDELKQGKCECSCPYYDSEEDYEERLICSKEYWKYIYKGMTLKNYELEKKRDIYNYPFVETMELRTSNKTYSCIKVIKDGEEIFNEYDNEEGI